MSGDDREDRAHEAVIEQASEWLTCLRAGNLSRAEKAAFLRWLQASRLNLEEYLEQVKLQHALKETLPTLGLDHEELLKRTQEELSGNVLPFGAEPMVATPPASEPRRFARPRVFAAVAASVILAAGAAWFSGVFTGTQRISVPRGEQRTVLLADGSTVHVNADSQMSVRFSKHERLIELTTGQALFEVAHDTTRPFRVRAGKTEVVAVGTQFDVYRRGDRDVTVTVVQGKVDVVSLRSSDEKPGGAAQPTGHLRLAAGDRVEVSGEGVTPVAHSTDVRAATAWMRREVIFKGEPLSTVVEELNRYIAVPLLIDDEDLKQMRVRGVFNAYDSESFLAFLKQYDVDIRVSPEAIRVRRRAPALEKPAIADRHKTFVSP
jgi:transmembrane sensor